MPKELRPIYANAGLRADYRRRLEKEVRKLAQAMEWWAIAAYRKQAPRMAQDAAPVAELERDLRRHFRNWLKKWDAFAERLAGWFGQQADATTTASLMAALKDQGFTVQFEKKRLTNAVTRSLIQENVNLIKSIASQYLTNVQGIVLRGMSFGRDVEFIRKELKKRYKITSRRAAFIARDQANKATEAIKRSRAESLGITRARWVHVPGVKTSRRTHQQMDGREYVLAEGMYDSAVGYKVKPGELPGCQCTCRFLIPELGE